jgi:cell division protein FtsQ
MSLRWRLARWAVALVAAAYAGHGLVTLVTDAGALRVSHVVVHGNHRLSNGEVLALLDGLRGESILGADLGKWRDRLLNSPWVADASLRRALPSTVDVVIAEREPFGIGRLGSGLYLIDERGTIIDEYGPNYAELDLPIVDGLAAPSAEGSLAIDQVRAELAMRLLRAVRVRNLGRHLSQVDVTDARNVVVILDGDPAWIRLGDDHFFERLQSYLDLAPALRERVPDIDYVDLRFDERVYVRPAAPPATRTTGPVEGTRGLSLDRLPKGGRGSNEG